ncbi:hypothetical protein Tco_0474101 [Tanacetum coccineum]
MEDNETLERAGQAMIELRADVELKDNIVAAMPKLLGKATILVILMLSTGETKNLKKTSQTPKGIPIGQKMGFKPTKQVYQPVSKKPTANASVNKKKNMELAKVVSKPLEKVASSCDYDSEDAVASVDNEMANFLAKKDGYGTQSLLEQWTESYKNDDYRYDPYDDDMYEGQDIPDKLQAICDKLDITIRGHQFLNETFIVEILKIGVRIGVEIPVPFGEEDEIGVLVKKKDVKMAIECLMDTKKENKDERGQPSLRKWLRE